MKNANYGLSYLLPPIKHPPKKSSCPDAFSLGLMFVIGFFLGMVNNGPGTQGGPENLMNLIDLSQVKKM
jgi:hypothetical protein